MLKITTDISTECTWVGQWQKFGTERPAAFWKASLRNPRFEQAKIRGIHSRKSTKSYSKTYVKTLKRLKERINRVRLEKINRCFFNMITPEPTLVFPFQQQYSTSDLKLFHTLSRAQIWHRLISCCSQLKETPQKN
jgi:hypothetical protein